MTNLSHVPDPPARQVDFHREDWPGAAPADTGEIAPHDELARREHWRHACQLWGIEHGLPWSETETVLSRIRGRLRASRASRYRSTAATAATPQTPGATSSGDPADTEEC